MIADKLPQSAKRGARFREWMLLARTYRFGEFELDLDVQQLRMGSERLHLERRPFDLLVLLVQNHDRLVSREEIIATLWPANVIIDFESGLNTLVRKIRTALTDSPDSPRYIETVPGRGYRFIETVTLVSATAPAAAPATTTSLARWRHLVIQLLLAVLLIGGATVMWRYLFSSPEPIRIAILPFQNLTGDERLGYLASGIAEETNTSLAAIDLPNLSVIGLVSTGAFADSRESIPTIGRELKVDYVVLSSLRLDQSHLRVTSRLVRAADGEQVWSASFDRELTNLLGLQRELSIAIAEQIRQRLSPDVAAAIDRRQTQNPEAYELYLKGRFEWTRFQPNSVSRALEFYRQAVEKDPEYALAWAGIAHALVTSVVTVEADRREVLPAANEALRHALEYGPELGETQLALGAFRFFLQRDSEGAEEASRQAIALDPNSAMSHMFLGLMLSENHNYVEARAMMRRARELDPLFPLIFANSSFVALAAKEPEEALEYATQAVAINPEFWVGYLHRGNALLALGNYDEALRSFTDAEKLSGNNSASATSSKAYVLAITGRVDEAREVLNELMKRAAERKVPPYSIAVVHAALGEPDLAFEWLEQEFSQRAGFCSDLERDPKLDNLRTELRFEELIARCRQPTELGYGDTSQ